MKNLFAFVLVAGMFAMVSCSEKAAETTESAPVEVSEAPAESPVDEQEVEEGDASTETSEETPAE